MKIKDLTTKQRYDFNQVLPKFEELLKINLSHLSPSSLTLYKRAAAFITVTNDLQDKETQDITIELVRLCLTYNNLSFIIGLDNTPNTSKNIKISAFKNLVEIYYKEINEKISTVAYDSVIKMLGKQGNIIRKIIHKNRITNENKTQGTYSWDNLINLNKEYLKTFLEIKKNYLKYNEIPDYIFLRDCLTSNLYLNNVFNFENYKFNVVLRNEYKSCYLHIDDSPPTNNIRNYFWVNLTTKESKLVINKNKTTGGFKRVKGNQMGHTQIKNQKKQKYFPLSEEITEIILFIQQVFHERKDKPFIKCNNRINNYTSASWSKMLGRVLKKIDTKIASSNLRRMYFYKIKNSNHSTHIKQNILEMSDFSLAYNPEDKSADLIN